MIRVYVTVPFLTAVVGNERHATVPDRRKKTLAVSVIGCRQLKINDWQFCSNVYAQELKHTRRYCWIGKKNDWQKKIVTKTP